MPLTRTAVSTESTGYATVGLFVGPVDHTAQITIDVSTLDNTVVDADGYLKPGTLLRVDGSIVSDTGQIGFGVVMEPIKVHTSNASLGSVTADVQGAVATIGQVNRDIGEDNLGRAYSANEIAAFAAASCLVKLLPT